MDTITVTIDKDCKKVGSSISKTRTGLATIDGQEHAVESFIIHPERSAGLKGIKRYFETLNALKPEGTTLLVKYPDGTEQSFVRGGTTNAGRFTASQKPRTVESIVFGTIDGMPQDEATLMVCLVDGGAMTLRANNVLQAMLSESWYKATGEKGTPKGKSPTTAAEF